MSRGLDDGETPRDAAQALQKVLTAIAFCPKHARAVREYGGQVQLSYAEPLASLAALSSGGAAESGR